MEKYADLLDIAIVNLKEANRLEELRDRLLYMITLYTRTTKLNQWKF